MESEKDLLGTLLQHEENERNRRGVIKRLIAMLDDSDEADSTAYLRLKSDVASIEYEAGMRSGKLLTSSDLTTGRVKLQTEGSTSPELIRVDDLDKS